tara:strand:+ start:50 stop:499 length:450 start_codon:yes stop_codon:yes gene_type:complete
MTKTIIAKHIHSGEINDDFWALFDNSFEVIPMLKHASGEYFVDTSTPSAQVYIHAIVANNILAGIEVIKGMRQRGFFSPEFVKAETTNYNVPTWAKHCIVGRNDKLCMYLKGLCERDDNSRTNDPPMVFGGYPRNIMTPAVAYPCFTYY